jgi:hypothetical protein
VTDEVRFPANLGATFIAYKAVATLPRRFEHESQTRLALSQLTPHKTAFFVFVIRVLEGADLGISVVNGEEDRESIKTVVELGYRLLKSA